MNDDRPLLKPARFSLWASAALVLGALLLWHGVPVPGEAPRGHRTLLHDVRLCSPGDGPGAPAQDLLWEDGVVLRRGAVGSLDASGALQVNGRGRIVAPALCDAAVFLSLEGRQAADSVPAGPRESLERQAAAGVSLLMDLNAHRSFIQAARQLKGTLPTALFAGALYTSSGGWRLSGQTPWSSHVVELLEPEDVDAPWGLALRFGDQAAFASVENEGRDGLAIPMAALKRLGALAHAQGLPFIIHVQHSAKALEALKAKPDALLGPLFDAGDGRLAQALRQQNVTYIPALSCLLNAFPPKPVHAWLASFPAAASLAPGVLAAATDPQRMAADIKHWERQGADPAQVLAVPATFAAAGVPMAFGSGSGLPLVFHGLGTATEIFHLRRAGLSCAQILQMSQRSRELLGRRPSRLRRGDPADLLLLDGDPWSDPANLAHPVQAYLGGVAALP